MNFEEVIQYIEKVKDDVGKLKLLFSKINLENPSHSKVIYEKLMDYAISHQLTNTYPWLLHYYGWIYYELGDLAQSIKYLEEAKAKFEENNDINGVVNALSSLVGIYPTQGIVNKSITYGIKALELAESIADYERISVIKMNMSVAYIEMADYVKAKSLLKQVESFYCISNKGNNVVCYFNLAECHIELGEVNEASECLERAMEWVYEEDENFLPHVLFQYGRLYTLQEKYEEAHNVFAESVLIARERGINLCLYDALLYWAELDLKLHHHGEALQKLKEIEVSLASINSRRNLKRIYQNLRVAYHGVECYKEAYEYLEKLYEIEHLLEECTDEFCLQSLDQKKEEDEEKIYEILYNQTEALYSMGQRITSNLHKEEIFNAIAEEIGNLFPCDALKIGLIKGEEIECQLAIDLGKRVHLAPTSLKNESIAGYCVRHKKEVFISDMRKDQYHYIRDVEHYLRNIEKTTHDVTRSIIYVPIIVNQKVIGVITTQSYKVNAFALKDLTNLKILATYLAIGLENARLYNELEYSATYDALTNIFNRKEALKRIEKKYNRLCHAKEQYCLMMIDIDNFKAINDTYGHQIGDQVIRQVAEAMQGLLGEEDIMGRYGGEEFIVLARIDDTYIEGAERLRQAIENMRVLDERNRAIQVTISIGITPLQNPDQSLNQCIGISDKALYKAKNTGKNRVVVN